MCAGDFVRWRDGEAPLAATLPEQLTKVLIWLGSDFRQRVK
jgi:hypothetical protein